MIGHILRRYRNANRLSQEQLAHRAGVDRTYVNKVERAIINPTILRVNRLLRAMDVTWVEFGEILEIELWRVEHAARLKKDA